MQRERDYRKFSFLVTPRKLMSFDDIIETAGLTDGYCKQLEDNKGNLFTEPTSNKIEELVLIYTGNTEFSGIKGYAVIENAHPSLLIAAMKILTAEKMEEIGMPHYVTSIVLPTRKNQYFNEYGKPCFLSAIIAKKYRKLCFTNKNASGNVYAMLLQKKC